MIAVLGGGGMLGREVGAELFATGIPVELFKRSGCDVTDTASVRRALAGKSAVINCAAYTKVDQAETEQELAFAVNAQGAGNVARVAADLGIPLLHVSTDYVFNGLKNESYVEDDAPSPLGAYAWSKAAGEEAVKASSCRRYIVRTGGLYGDGPNFFRSIIARVRKSGFDPVWVAQDRSFSPTWTRDLAKHLISILRNAPPGTYHCTARGSASPYSAALTALHFAGISPNIAPVLAKWIDLPALRPQNAVLSCQKLAALSLYKMRPWYEALEDWIKSGGV